MAATATGAANGVVGVLAGSMVTGQPVTGSDLVLGVAANTVGELGGFAAGHGDDYTGAGAGLMGKLHYDSRLVSKNTGLLLDESLHLAPDFVEGMSAAAVSAAFAPSPASSPSARSEEN